MKSSDLDSRKFYLKKTENGNLYLLNSYSFYGDLNVTEIENIEFDGKLLFGDSERGCSNSTYIVEVLGHPMCRSLKAEIGLGSLKDILLYCSSENGIVSGKFKFGKRGKNYFIVPVKK